MNSSLPGRSAALRQLSGGLTAPLVLIASVSTTSLAQETHFEIRANPNLIHSYDPRTALPSLDGNLVRMVNNSGYFSGNPPTTLTNFFQWEMQDLPPGYATVSSFSHRLIRPMSAGQLGVGDCNTDLNAIFAAYFAANPNTPWAIGWWSTPCHAGQGLFGQISSSVQLPTTLVPTSACGTPVYVTLRVFGGPLGNGAVGLAFDGQVDGYQICIAAEDRGPWGHTFVTASNARSTGSSEIISAGKYPDAPTLINMFSAPGIIYPNDNAENPCIDKVCFRATADQYQAIINYIISSAQHPSRYRVMSDNCTSWAIDALASAGIDPGFSGINGFGVPDPYAATGSLRRAGDTLGACGRVTHCTPLAPDRPVNVSPQMLSALMTTDPAAAASEFGVPLVNHAIDDTSVRTRGTLTVSVLRDAPRDQLLSIEWGDASPPTLVEGDASHTYQSPGDRTARAAIIDSGSVQRFDLTIHVSDTAPAVTTVQLRPDELPPSGVPNPLGSTVVSAVDGTADANYGSALAVQDTQTSFDNNLQGSASVANGSELDGAYGRICHGVLYLTLAGNLSSNYTHLDVFFDTVPGGQTQVSSTNPSVNFGALQALSGLQFDSDFGADYYLTLNGGNSPYRFFVDYARLGSAADPGTGLYLGETTAVSTGDLVGGNPNALGIRATINNINTAGVGSGIGRASGAGVRTGVELAIPLGAIGNPQGPIKVCCLLTSPNRSVVSNQMLPGRNGGASLSVPATNLSAISGNQYFTVPVPLTLRSQPQSAAACPGGSAAFSVSADSPSALTYLWRHNGAPIAPNENPTVQTSTITINVVDSSSLGVYDCIIYSDCGQITSASASLSICFADFNCDGGIDGADIDAFFSAWESGSDSADVNLDGGVDGSDVSDFFVRWENGSC